MIPVRVVSEAFSPWLAAAFTLPVGSYQCGTVWYSVSVICLHGRDLNCYHATCNRWRIFNPHVTLVEHSRKPVRTRSVETTSRDLSPGTKIVLTIPY